MSTPRVRGHRRAGPFPRPPFQRHYGSEIGVIAAVVGAAAAAAGTGVAVYGAQQQAVAAEKAGKYNARLAENQALQAQYAGQVAAREQRARGLRVLGLQRSLTAGAGVTPEGSPLLVMMDTAAQSELDAQNALYTGQVQAESDLARATYARYQGRSASQAAQIGAGATLLQGFGNVAGRASSFYGRPRPISPNDVQAL